MSDTTTKRMIGDSYQADPVDLEKLRKIAESTGKSKASLVREGIRMVIESHKRMKR